MSAGLIYDLSGLQKLEARVRRLSRSKKPELLVTIGALVESQTRRRIQSEKESPTGEAWPFWSKRYAKRRPAGRTLLMNEDHLLDSITHLTVDQDSIEVGSNMVYAGIHQFGGEIEKAARSETFIRNRDKGKFSKGTKAGHGFTFGAHSVNMPARTFLGISEVNEMELIRNVDNYLDGIMRR